MKAKPLLVWAFVISIGALSGSALTRLIRGDFESVNEDHLFVTENPAYSHFPVQKMRWETLLPADERDIHQRYSPSASGDLSAQIADALAANQDLEWQAAQISMNANPELNGIVVSIPGFIVPVDVTRNNQIVSFFLVPYYGACLHYPPPPPNQIIYVRVDGELAMTNLEKAYLIEGYLENGLYEDPVGTSAYLMALTKLSLFEGEPDDVRRHDS